MLQIVTFCAIFLAFVSDLVRCQPTSFAKHYAISQNNFSLGNCFAGTPFKVEELYACALKCGDAGDCGAFEFRKSTLDCVLLAAEFFGSGQTGMTKYTEIGGGPLQMAVNPTDISPVNIALNQPAELSDPMPPGANDASAYKAVLGLRTGIMWVSVASSVQAEDPWFMVDLEGNHLVAKLIITNRVGCCPNRLDNPDTGVFVDHPSTKNYAITEKERCIQISGYPNPTETYYCDNPVLGRYVVLKLYGTRFLTLGGLEVYELTC